MTQIHSYKDLLVWQKSIELTSSVYAITKKFPTAERFGLTSQIQRASVSVAANIAEGHGRGTRSDYAHFLDMANGSRVELETLITIAKNISYCTPEECSKLEKHLNEIGKMLVSLRSKLRTSISSLKPNT